MKGFLKRIFGKSSKDLMEKSHVHGNSLIKGFVEEEGWETMVLYGQDIDYERLIKDHFEVVYERHTRYMDLSKSPKQEEEKWPCTKTIKINVDSWEFTISYVLTQGQYKSKAFGYDIQFVNDGPCCIMYKREHRQFIEYILEKCTKDYRDILPKLDLTKVKVSYLVSVRDELFLKDVNLKNSSKYNPKDYNMNYTVEVHDAYKRIFNRIKNPGSAIHILHGPPGCGKTALIRKLIVQISKYFGDYHIIYLAPNLLAKLGNEEFTGWLMNMCEHTSGPIVFVFEDTGEFIAENTSSTRHPATVAMLNLVDGILGESLFAYGIHMVISYNNTTDVDEAIVRRASNTTIEILPLTAEHADAWCEHHNIPPLGISMKLYELYEYLHSVTSPNPERSSENGKSDTGLEDFPV